MTEPTMDELRQPLATVNALAKAGARTKPVKDALRGRESVVSANNLILRVEGTI